MLLRHLKTFHLTEGIADGANAVNKRQVLRQCHSGHDANDADQFAKILAGVVQPTKNQLVMVGSISNWTKYDVPRQIEAVKNLHQFQHCSKGILAR